MAEVAEMIGSAAESLDVPHSELTIKGVTELAPARKTCHTDTTPKTRVTYGNCHLASESGVRTAIPFALGDTGVHVYGGSGRV